MAEAKLRLYRGAYCAVWRAEGATRRASLRTSDLDEAKRRFIDWQNARKRTGGTVSEIVAAYLIDKADKASADVMGWSWKPLKSVFGHLLPEHVTRPLSRAYAQQRRREKMSESTIRRETSFLRAALRWHNKATPAVVEVPPAPPPRTYYLTRIEWFKFREASKAVAHIHLFAVLAYTTAARSQAILELRWDQVDFTRGLVNFGQGQTRYKGRAVVPMNATSRLVLEDARKSALSDYVVEWGGEQVGSVKKGFATAAERAGFPALTPHVLRHTAAVHMVEAGVEMEDISQYLGHTNTTVTRNVYARFSPEYLRKAASALD